VHLAARAVLEQARSVAAATLEVDPGELVVREGGLEIAGTPRRLTFAEIERLLRAGGESPAGLSAARYFHLERETWSFGVVAAAARVDVETGTVAVERLVLSYGVGRAINRSLVEGQLQGGAVQGLGGTLFEHLPYGEDGTPLATSFMDYLVPTSIEAPVMTILASEEDPAGTNPLGVKGAGESGVTGVASAVASAVEAAVGRAGLVRSLPITPERLWAELAD
jgi:CO/xanthine dehydrogenase Mo-binding subunit